MAQKRLMSNGTLRPQRPGKFDRFIAAMTFAVNVVQLNNAMSQPIRRKEFPIGGKIFSNDETREFIARPAAPMPLPSSIIKDI